MQRGIINLTRTEAQLAQLLAENSSLDLTSFRAKARLAVASVEESNKLEVNRDEVEALLDCLPAPAIGQDQSYQQLREKLQSFLVTKYE
ncbi:hypothetical protein KJZ63_04525 [Patescibacteria group bacterium]|nr:hypothetical protein [Patescibacteria group bacterium]